MPRTYEEARALFDRWAQHYDEVVRSPGGPLEGYAESLQEAAALLPLGQGAHILDVGIGTGTFAALFAERTGAQARRIRLPAGHHLCLARGGAGRGPAPGRQLGPR